MKRFLALLILTGMVFSMTNNVTENPKVIMQTSMGAMTIELFADKAPISVDNFLKYADQGFYNDTVFHRVIPGFMVQGGGFTPSMDQKETMAPIKNEADNGLGNKRGTLAMARTAVVDSATAQFFINLVDNKFLDFQDKSTRGYGYCVFGAVVEGMDVADKIAKVETGNFAYYQDVPKETVLITSVTRVGATANAEVTANVTTSANAN